MRVGQAYEIKNEITWKRVIGGTLYRFAKTSYSTNSREDSGEVFIMASRWVPGADGVGGWPGYWVPVHIWGND